jgi:hypothetical protein
VNHACCYEPPCNKLRKHIKLHVKTNKQEGHDGPESLTSIYCISVLEIKFQMILLKGKSSYFGKFNSTLTCPSCNKLSQHWFFPS